jgi:hypothetical protein
MNPFLKVVSEALSTTVSLPWHSLAEFASLAEAASSFYYLARQVAEHQLVCMKRKGRGFWSIATAPSGWKLPGKNAIFTHHHDEPQIQAIHDDKV